MTKQNAETTNPQAIEGQSRSEDRSVIQSAIDLLDQWLSDIEAAQQFESENDSQFTKGYSLYRKHCKARMEETIEAIRQLRVSHDDEHR